MFGFYCLLSLLGMIDASFPFFVLETFFAGPPGPPGPPGRQGPVGRFDKLEASETVC